MRKALCHVMFVAAVVTTAGAQATVNVVATTQDYAAIAREIGGDRVTVAGIVPGNSDPHFLKPKPSYALMLRDADLLISTGLDLELWLPVLVNKAGNRNIVEGSPGFVAVAQGLELLEKPVSLSRSEGDVHVFGNPHIHTSPINAKIIARNIATGLCKVDAAGCPSYQANLTRYNNRLTRRVYGDALVELLGPATLDRLAAGGELVPFLERQGIADKLAGWLGQARSLHGRKLITYHKNWAYLTTLLGLQVLEYVEPKPGIPPTARHVADLIELISAQDVPVLLAANYFEQRKPQAIADRTGIIPVIAPLSVGGEPGIDTYEGLFDAWITRLVRAYDEAGTQGGPHRHRHRHGGEQAPAGGPGTTPTPGRQGEGR